MQQKTNIKILKKLKITIKCDKIILYFLSEEVQMKIGFIGCGNMATAIIKGVIDSKIIDSNNIFLYDKNKSALDNVSSKYNAVKCENASETAKNSDIIVLAVKPNIIQSVLCEINGVLKNSNKLIISIAAGKTIEFIRNCLTQNNRIVRVMPNINAKVGEAICAYCYNNEVTDDDKKNVCEILSGIGKVIELDESFFSLFGVIGGCSPAFVYMFIDALARAGVENGMSKDMALEISAQAVYGSAKMILENLDTHPWKLIDMVCSPGGTTVEGVLSLQQNGFESSIHQAVNKAIEKDKKL